jgi:hypothetical protein
MKSLLAILIIVVLFSGNIFAQKQVIANDNTLTALIDGKEFSSQPRRIKLGNYYWITANTTGPDKSLRFWFVDFEHTDKAPVAGKYLIVDEKYPSEKTWKQMIAEGNFKGMAVVKYVEETKSPRMEYHVGNSWTGEGKVGEINLKPISNGFLEGTFTVSLAGKVWKERVSATVFGGGSRLLGKLTDKAKTSATGYNYDIDPEGNGYKKQDGEDKIEITNGKFKLKFEN